MAENSKIEWCDHTFNPWMGCVKVSPGCEHCYAEAMMDSRYGRVQWGENGTRALTSDANWRKPLKWNRDADAIQQYHSANLGTDPPRPRVFCASLADVFEDREELLPWLARLVMLIEECTNLDWLVLTKRPEKVLERLEWVGCPPNWLYENSHVWLGVSAENQTWWDRRVSVLRDINARRRFVSVEPMIGPINAYDQFFVTEDCEYIGSARQMIDWVIVGGESGPGARPMHPDWVRSIRDQCQAAGVPFHFKQWGAWAYRDPEQVAAMFPEGKEFAVPLNWRSRPERYRCMTADGKFTTGYDGGTAEFLVRVGKKAAGRMLDGREWSEFPEPVRS